MSKRSRIFLVWFMSYLFVLSIPILFFAGFQIQNRNMLMAEVRKSNDAMLTQVQQNIDYQLKDIRRLSSQLLNDPRMSYFIQNMEYESARWRLTAVDLIASFAGYKSANSIISNFYVYESDYKLGLTTTTLNKGDMIYDNFHRKSGISKAGWEAWMASHDDGSFMNLAQSDSIGTMLAYSQSIQIPNVPRDSVKLIVFLNNERMLQVIENVKLNNESIVLVMGPDGKVIMSTNSDNGLSQAIAAKFRPGDFGTSQTIRWNDSKLMVSSLNSEETGWTYFTAVPKRIYDAQVTKLQLLIVLYLVLCIGIGGALAYWMTRKNYRPIESMVDFVSNKVKYNLKSAGNEFALLQAFMADSVTRHDENEKRLLAHHKEMRANFLGRLLRGKLAENPSVLQMLETYGIRFDADNFAVMLVQIEDYNELFRSGVKMDVAEREHFVHMIVTNIIEETVQGEGHLVYSIALDNDIAFLINIRGEADEARTRLAQAASDTMAFIQSKFLLRFTMSFSDVRMYWDGISTAYRDAVEAVEYKFILGQNQFIPYDRVSKPKEELDYPLEVERQLINHVVTGSYEEAAVVVRNIMLRNIEGGTLSIQLGKCLMFEMIGTMLKAVEQINMNSKADIVEKMDLFRTLVRCETFAEMEAEMLLFLKSVCDYMQKRKKSHNSDMRDEIKSYVLQHLHDPNLSLTMISAEFDISSSYLSRFFKEQFGGNLLDFIQRERIELAKKWLREEDQPIHEIIERAGFTNLNTFTRVFKRHESMTPGQYKALFLNNTAN
ncbi:helix-turn-helix transcriptional regulator [Paenibacillus glycanilyticus]|uniref:HTH araC/xylS-type domain-containing protein n=1 Tax=Paenibacillus glycanilyticus TaxID=126569 RepID=A0ABQ6GNI2_9BACL|nr:AraC family transcriptional regulator [Paenibacillus glycanilyticus]GLX71162.1 hypothetical protein MU1_55110 [Paenibacillus glycanilyticus]